MAKELADAFILIMDNISDRVFWIGIGAVWCLIITAKK